MTKEELVYLIENLNSEDRNGTIEGISIGRHGERVSTDSIRVEIGRASRRERVSVLV